MHRIALPDGTYRQSTFLQGARTAAYLLMASSGGFLLVSKVFREGYTWRVEAMAWFLLVGGLAAMSGAASRRWVGEFTGLPLLASAFSVFSIVSLRQTWVTSPFLALATCCLYASVALMLLSRWRIVLAIYKMSLHLGKAEHE